MKKALLILTILLSLKGFSQSGYTTVSFNKQQKPALMLTLPYKEDVAEGAILENLRKTGYDPETKGKLFWKQNKVNGFYTFKEVNLNNHLVDLYFKVDQKNKRSQQSTIYLLVSRGNENFVSSSDGDVYESARTFLNGFTSETASYKLQLDIEEQEKTIKNAEKELEEMKDDEKDMEKKIERLQEDLKKNRNDQEKQVKTIEDEKKKLAELKEKAVKG